MMTPLQQLAHDYRALCKGSVDGPWQQGPLLDDKPVSLEVMPHPLEKAPGGPIDQAVQDEIAAFAPIRGWLCRQSSIETIGVPWGPSGPHDSPILDGELVNAEGQSLHIRHVGQSWIVTRYIEAAGDDFLVERTCFENEYADPARSANTGLPNEQLLYARYWTIDDDRAVVAHARFTGFAP